MLGSCVPSAHVAGRSGLVPQQVAVPTGERVTQPRAGAGALPEMWACCAGICAVAFQHPHTRLMHRAIVDRRGSSHAHPPAFSKQQAQQART